MDPLRLSPDVYWRLRYLQAESDAATAKAQMARLMLDAAAREAGLPTAGDFRWDDASHTLIPMGTP